MTDPNLGEREGGPASGARHEATGESGGGGARVLPLSSVGSLRQEGGACLAALLPRQGLAGAMAAYPRRITSGWRFRS